MKKLIIFLITLFSLNFAFGQVTVISITIIIEAKASKAYTVNIPIDEVSTKLNTKKLSIQTDVLNEDTYLTISLDDFKSLDGVNIYLKDNLLNRLINLKQESYSFMNSQKDIAGRFEVFYSKTPLNIGAEVIIQQNGGYFNIKTSNDINIKCVNVFDNFGREIANYRVNSNSLQIPNFNINKSVIIIKTTLDNGNVITKKVINIKK